MLLRLDIRRAVLADLQHMAVLTDANRATISTLEFTLLFECTEILADAILCHLELFAEIADANLSVTREHL